ncbi:MAG: hypothetical protein WBD47_13560 [Phormidesmis sp.]
MATAYWTAAGITFLVVMNAFLKDREASKNSASAWIFIGLATLLWPVTLPFIINRKVRAARARHQEKLLLQRQNISAQASEPSERCSPLRGTPVSGES